MKAFNYQKIIRGSQRWFNDACKAWMWDEPRTGIAAFLENAGASGLWKAVGGINKLGAWHARRGCVLLGEGKTADGWQELKRSFDYGQWQLRLEVEQVRIANTKGRQEANPTFTPFHLLGMATAFRDWDSQRWLGDNVVASRNSRLFGYWTNSRRGCFRSYLCEIYARSTGSGGFADDFGPYTSIFSGWNEPQRLDEAICAACDYHVQQIKADGEFENNPHDIFPSEILALYRIRERLGLETPAVKHALLDTPFTDVPESINYEPDSLVQAAADLAMRLLPEAITKR